MPSTVTWLGHGSAKVETSGKTLLIDPFLDEQPTAPCKASDLDADYILVSHGHYDHVADVAPIATRTNAMVICNFELSQYFAAQDVLNIHAQHIGGAHRFDFGTVKLTIAHHGSMLPDGSNGGNPCGFLLKLEDANLYFACDTGLFYDMRLIGEEGVDLAALPIGDNFTMGPEDSIRAIKLINPRKVMPMHFNTWDLIHQDVEAWADRVRSETSAEPILTKPGQPIVI